jgi:manganese/zinc/iron transport system substrate-binding protein
MNNTVRLAAAACLVACGLPPALAPASPPRKHQIVTTVGMVTDIVSQVAGDRAEVRGLVASGIDPHLYKPTRNDVAALQSADAVFYSGLVLEGKMTDALVRLARNGKKVYAVTELLDEKYLLEPPEAPGHHDPHVWMDVAAWSRAVEAVAAALAEFDPEGAEHYRANAGRYQEQLARLDAYVREVIATVPERQRVLITAHDAFNYFGRAYNVKVMGVQGISTESEAGLEDIKRLVDFIVAHDVQAVFVETSVAERNVRALIEGARARGKTVRIGGTLYSDAMGPPGAYEGTYIGMIDHNATTIARALGGKAPERGLNGKLNAAE